MTTTIDISELRLGCLLDDPVYDDKNVTLLGKGETITRSFVSELRRQGVREVQVTDEDLAKLRGWRLSVNSPPGVDRKMVDTSNASSVVEPTSEFNIDQEKLYNRETENSAAAKSNANDVAQPLKS